MKRRITILPISIVLLLSAFLLAMPLGAYAQQFSFSVSPPLVELTTKPGKSVLIAYTVTNGGDPTVISADIRPFKPLGITGDVQLGDDLEGPIRFSLDNSNIQLGKPFRCV